MKKILFLSLLTILSAHVFSQGFDLNTIKQRGLGGMVQNSSGISADAIKFMKGKIAITSQAGVKKTLKCAVAVQSTDEMAAYMKDEKQKKKLQASGVKGMITISCSDESGDNVVIISGQYYDGELSGNVYDLQKQVGHMSMHNTFQLMPFGKDGLLTLKKNGSNWKFSGSTQFENKKGGLAVVVFEGEAPVQTTKAPASTQPNMPTRIDPNQEAKDAMKKKPTKGTKLPTKL
ncbi:MAG: hypothetical protein BGN96_08355 [Bacteroidales bacterium 45-6]|nr:MAG: hypothetical protein BGN96_08355 [Bacteroidales bacterium 45-6]